MKKLAMLRWSPLIGLVMGFMVAAWLGWYIHNTNRIDEQESFNVLAQRAARQLNRRLELYEYGLRGARGALIAGGHEQLSRDVFSHYSKSRDYAREFPGARGFGFIRRVPLQDESEFLNAARQDGWSGFTIRQLSNHAGERFVIQYIEPVKGNEPAVGLDIASEPNRRSAALQSLQTGSATITDPITLVQTDGQKNQGFLILLPVCRTGAVPTSEAERNKDCYGWVYTPINIQEVLRDFDFYEDQIALSIRAMTPTGQSHPFYNSPGSMPPNTNILQTSELLSVFGKTWEVNIQARPAFDRQLNLPSPWSMPLLIAVLSLAATAVVWRMQEANTRYLRMESEAKLNHANRSYRLLIDSVKDYAIIQLDLDGRVVGWNTGAQHIKGYSEQEIIGKHMAVFYPPDEFTPAQLAEKLATALRDGVQHDEGWRVRKDGSRFWGAVAITPMYDDEQRPYGFSKLTQDLSERRAKELELHRLLSLQQAILNNAGVAIIATEIDGRISLFNPSAERLLGYSKDEVVGKLTPAAFHDRAEVEARAVALSQELGAPIKPGLATLGAKALRGQVDTHEWTYIKKDGQRVPVLLSVTGIFDAHNNPIGSLGLAADLSDQKRYQKQLEDARAAAESASLAKSSFLANMSHEIRTPMNAILGMTQLVLQGNLDAHERGLLEKSFVASKALLNILNDVLDYSKVEAGQLQLEERVITLEDVLADAVNLFAHQAEQKGLELILDVSADLPAQVQGDPLRLGQVLSNLLSNAVKFTSAGTVTLAAKAIHTSLESTQIRFAVSDTGVGISPTEAEQLFKPFSQADASITRKFGGTGLGLSICKRFVGLMQGNLDVSSTPGVGSEFFFTLEMPVVHSALQPQATLGRVPFRRALVVDDHLASAQVIESMLHRWGVDTQATTSALSAIELLKQAEAAEQPYDLLLTDWQMPEMDGLELVRRVSELAAKHEITKAPNIMMVSAYGREKLLGSIQNHKITEILTKPVIPSDLYNLLTGLGSHPTPIIKPLDTVRAKPSVPNYITDGAILRARHVLLAEDNEVNQLVAEAFLRSAGMEVTVAVNGHEALALAQSQGFAAILMDMHMPEMDGLEATRRIRATPGLESLPIIAMTAAVMPEDQHACHQAGMNGFIGKPINPAELIEVLKQWVQPQNRPSPDQPISQEPLPECLRVLSATPGFETEAALQRMGGDTALCVRLLQEFATRADTLLNQVDSLPLTELPSWVHKLKGETANLGLTALAMCCTEVESALRHSPSARPSEAISELKTTAQQMSLQIRQTVWVNQADVGTLTRATLSLHEHEQLSQLLTQLRIMLREQRMQALQISDQVHALMAGTPIHTAYEHVHKAIGQLQFAAALAALNDVKLKDDEGEL